MRTDGWRCLCQAKAHLGERTIWDARDGAIYWLDVEAPAILWLELDSGRQGRWTPPRMINSIAARAKDGFVGAGDDGFVFVDPLAGTYEPVTDPRNDKGATRFNDGVLDREGRFWSGTVDSDQWAETTTMADKEATVRNVETRARAGLYRLDPSQRAERTDGGYIACNGPAFSPDGKTLYENDSIKRVTYAYDLRPDGSLSNKREFLRFDTDHGFPDGMTCDAEGGLWIAFYDDPYLRRFGPDGALLEQRTLPVRQGLRPAFGEPQLDRLFLSSGTLAFDEKAWAEQPLGGSLFEILEPGVAGVPTVAYEG